MTPLLTVALAAATPLLLAVLSEVLVERSGVINIGLEGILLASALAASAGAHHTGSASAGLLAGAVTGVFCAVFFGLLTLTLRADQVVSGAALNLLALGATSFIYRLEGGASVLASNIPTIPPLGIPVVRDAAVLVSWTVLPLMIALVLRYTRTGLRLRACGEAPAAAEAAGVNVKRYRWGALVAQGIIAGCGGGYLALALSSGFAENMSAGRGFIALAIVIFGRWTAAGAVAGAAVFGGLAALQYVLQSANSGFPFHLMLAIPYVVTLLILILLPGTTRQPESLGRV